MDENNTSETKALAKAYRVRDERPLGCPGFNVSADERYIIRPEEIFCRMPRKRRASDRNSGNLCSENTRFASRSDLTEHMRKVHPYEDVLYRKVHEGSDIDHANCELASRSLASNQGMSNKDELKKALKRSSSSVEAGRMKMQKTAPQANDTANSPNAGDMKSAMKAELPTTNSQPAVILRSKVSLTKVSDDKELQRLCNAIIALAAKRFKQYDEEIQKSKDLMSLMQKAINDLTKTANEKAKIYDQTALPVMKEKEKQVEEISKKIEAGKKRINEWTLQNKSTANLDHDFVQSERLAFNEFKGSLINITKRQEEALKLAKSALEEAQTNKQKEHGMISELLEQIPAKEEELKKVKGAMAELKKEQDKYASLQTMHDKSKLKDSVGSVTMGGIEDKVKEG